jgi:helicase SWR1
MENATIRISLAKITPAQVLETRPTLAQLAARYTTTPILELRRHHQQQLVSEIQAIAARHDDHVQQYMELKEHMAPSLEASTTPSPPPIVIPSDNPLIPKHVDLEAYMRRFVLLDEPIRPQDQASIVQHEAFILEKARDIKHMRFKDAQFEGSRRENAQAKSVLAMEAGFRRRMMYRMSVVHARNKAIEKYFFDKEMEKERAKREEEAHGRRIARTIARMVMNQWELAERVVLAQVREREQLEEKEAGLERLNTLVEHSANILSSQRDLLVQEGNLKRKHYEDEAASAKRVKSSSESESEEEEELTLNIARDKLLSDMAEPVSQSFMDIPFLLKHPLREYQISGLKWLVNLYETQSSGILAGMSRVMVVTKVDEMGLGKTIQTIALFAYLAVYRGIWGPHLVVAPTSVVVNWERELKKWCPGFKILTYTGNVVERSEKRKGWSKDNAFHVCLTSYQLALADQKIFKRRPWCYLVLDEGHYIKNFMSQRWQALLSFNSQRRLILTGTPLQNNLTELWSLMYFLMPEKSSSALPEGFASRKEFKEWFGESISRLIEHEQLDTETESSIKRLHTILRPFMLRRMKAQVEKQLPKKYEHLVLCALSKRQKYLYDDFLSRAKSQNSVQASYLSVINVIMQLRKICNHPNLITERPVASPFVVPDTALLGYESTHDAVRRLFAVDGMALHLRPKQHSYPVQERPLLVDEEYVDFIMSGQGVWTLPLDRPPVQLDVEAYNRSPVLSHRPAPFLGCLAGISPPSLLLPPSSFDMYEFCIPKATCTPSPSHCVDPPNNWTLPYIRPWLNLPDGWLLQHDCGKLHTLYQLLMTLRQDHHRVLIFTQMTRMLDILESFLNMHGMRYLRLDGSTPVEQRLVLTERFNNDPKIFVFISSTRAGGIGVNLTGADTVVFYDSDWSYQMDKQCQDRCHRIGQTRNVHIYRLVCQHTIEDAILRKSNQKRMLDNVVIQQGEFTTDHLEKVDWRQLLGMETSHDIKPQEFDKAILQVEDAVDIQALQNAESEMKKEILVEKQDQGEQEPAVEEEDGVGDVNDYMIAFVKSGQWIR